MPSWCDKLASTPGLGVKLDTVYAPAAALLEPLAPVISKWVEKDKPAFTIDGQDLFSFSLTTFDGYFYAASSDQLAVEFRHRLRLQPKSAGPPTAEMISKPLPYTQLLPKVTERLTEVIRLVSSGKTRKLVRIGVVSTTLVNQEDAPPGIVRFLEHVAKPWKADFDFYNVQLTAKLPRGKRTQKCDRCIHMVSKPEDSDGLINIRLDWQRYLDEDRTLSMTSLPELLENAKVDALAYFEDIGQGERFDESSFR